ncbi:hypothetical protein Tco_1350441 [Tanacetum coccineum]
MVSPRPSTSGCKFSRIPYSEVNSSRYSSEMVETAPSNCMGPPNKFTWYKNKVLHIRIAAYSDLTRPDLTFVSTSWRHPWDPTLGTTLDFCEEHYEDILPVIMDKIRRDKRKEVHTRLNFGDNTKRSRRTRESSQNSSARTWSVRHQNPSKKPRVKDRSRDGDGNVFGRLGHRRQSAFDRLSNTYSPSTTKSGPDRTSSRDHSKIRGRPHRWDSPPSRVRSRSKDRSHGIKESYDNTYSSYRTESRHGHRSRDRGRSRIMKRGRTSESPLSRVSKSDTSDGGH